MPLHRLILSPIMQKGKKKIRGSNMSEASEDVEMLSKLSSVGTVKEDPLPKKLHHVFDQGTTNKNESSKGEEGHDENISCFSGANDTNQSVGYINRIDVDRKNASCSSLSVSCIGPEGFGKSVQYKNSLDISCDVEYSRSNCWKQSGYTEDTIREVHPINLSTDLNPKKLDLPPKDTGGGNSFSNGMSPCCHSQGGKSPEKSNLKDLVEDTISDLQEKPPEYDVAASEGVIGQSATKHCANNLEDRESSLDGCSSDVLIKINPKFASETDKSSRAPSDKALKCSEKNAQGGKLNESGELPDMQELPLPSASASGDENDESDIVEHDVKVCDICGDAGREDLLAICSRCSDGAEHTYCMRQKLDKVPECDWLCEECEVAEGAENQRQGKCEMVGENEKTQNSECPSTVDSDLFVKLDSRDTDVEVYKTSSSDHEVDRTDKVSKSSQVTGKRRLDNFEAAPVSKGQVLKTTVGSPKASGPHRTAALSHDWSFKSLGKGKVKPACHPSSGARSINKVSDATRSSAAQRLRTPRDTLLKSKSFSTSNFQMKAKPAGEAISQKLKGTRGPAQTDGPVRLIGKSLSFKSVSLGRPNATEAKVKTISPKVSHVREQKRFKQGKEWNNLEKKNSFRLDRSSSSSSAVSALKVDQMFTFHGEANLSNDGDFKAVHSDGRLASSLKSISHLTRKGVEIPVALESGEVKRQFLCVPNAVGASSTDEASSSAEQTPKQERTFNASGILQDGLPLSRESMNQDDKLRDNSVVRTRQSVTTGGRSLPCQKGNEIRHAAQFSTSSSPRVSAVVVSDARSSGEQIGSGSRLKAAIEAAMLKKPGIYKKNRLADPYDEFPVSSTDLNCELVSQGQSSIPSDLRNISGDGIHGGYAALESWTSDCSKKSTDNNAKQSMVLPAEAEFSPKDGDSDSNIFSDGKVSMKDLCSHASAAVSVPEKISVIPEHEYMWQGGFEVHRSGKLADLFNGFQAHLSTCASPKVLEAVCKFPEVIPLNEVTRLSTWPTQFHNNAVKDDSIALYFFAKDLESYERNYKPLLESMMKNDLALKGNFDGIELLIFSSHQLPEKSQRWNMLFFLWGVFRGKRVSCLDEISGSLKKLHNSSLHAVHQNGITPVAVMSIPESLCTLQHLDRVSSACDRSCSVSLASNPFAEVKLPATLSSAIDQTRANLQENLGHRDRKFDLPSLSKTPTRSASLCQEMRCTTNSMKEQTDSDCGPDRDHRPSAEVTGTMRIINQEKILDGEKGEVRYERNLKEGEKSIVTELKEEEGLMETEAVDGRCMLTRMLSVTEPSGLQLNHRKRMYPTLVEAAPQTSAGTCQTVPWTGTNCTLTDGGRVSKKPKTGLSEIYGSSSSSCVSSLGGLLSSSLGANIRTKKSAGTCDETDNLEKSVTSERHFFPVDLQNMEQAAADNSVTYEVQPSADEDRQLIGTPNLDLALGAETKLAKQGILPFFVGKLDEKTNLDKPPDTTTAVEEEMEDATSLSLSLSFPYSDQKERAAKPVSKTEQFLAERHHVNTSLLLFGGFQDG